MGTSSSTLEIAQLCRSFLSNESVDAERVRLLLTSDVTEEIVARALPTNVARELRHSYTKNFATILHECIGAVAAVAAQRRVVNCSTCSSVSLLPPEMMRNFKAALSILKQLLPFALESGDTVQSPEESSTDVRDHGVGNSGDIATTSADGTRTDNNTGETTDISSHSITSPTTAPSRTRATMNFQELFFLRGSTCDDDNPNALFPPLPHQNGPSSPSGSDGKASTLSVFLLRSLIECCFIRGLTLPEARKFPAEPQYSISHPEVDVSLLWSGGIGSTDPYEGLLTSSDAPHSLWLFPTVARNRKSLLDILLATLSSPLYHATGYRDTLFMEPLLSIATVPLMPTLALSMLNTVLHYIPYGSFPYSSYFGPDEKQMIVSCVRLLDSTLCCMGAPLDSILFEQRSSPNVVGLSGSLSEPQGAEVSGDHSSLFLQSGPQALPREDDGAVEAREKEGKREEDTGMGSLHILSTVCTSEPAQQSADAPSESASINTGSATATAPPRFVHSVRKSIKDMTLTEAKVFIDRLRNTLGVNAYSEHTFLPESQSKFESLDDFVMLFWKVLDLSPVTLVQFGNSSEALSYVVPILNYGMVVRRSSMYTYRFQLMLFILARLSEVRGFVLQCNQVFPDQLPFRFPKLPPNRTYNDIIILALTLVMEMRDQPNLISLFSTCSTVIANISPFITALGRAPSIKMVSVFASAAHRCIRSSAAPTPPGPTPAPASTTSATPSNGQNAGISDFGNIIHQTVMVNMCEAIANQLQYQGSGSLYLLASLVDHRVVIREAKEAYIVQRTRTLTIQSPSPFLITTLEAAVSLVLPVVESTDALRKTSKFYTNSGATSSANTNSEYSREPTNALTAFPITGPPEVGLAESDEVVSRLQNITLVGVLPTPHSISLHRFQSTKFIEEWTTVSFWTSSYIHTFPGLLGDRYSVKLLQFF